MEIYNMKSCGFIFLVLFLSLLLSRPVLGDDSKSADSGVPVANIFISSPQLPATFKRVVVLPMASEESSADLADGCQMLDSVLRTALIKTSRFEVVPATPETLRRCTGQASWTGTETLPPDFFTGLKDVYGCDGVLFCELTIFRPTPPLAVGWRLKLADAGTGKIIWAADEIFDANNLNVAKDAQQFQRREQPHHNAIYYTYSFLAWCVNTPTRTALDDQWNVLHSPRYFGEYSAEKLLQTLPQR
jgi:hypothetical protein